MVLVLEEMSREEVSATKIRKTSEKKMALGANFLELSGGLHLLENVCIILPIAIRTLYF